MEKELASYYLPLKQRQKKLAQFHLSSSGWRKKFLKHSKTAALAEEELAILTSAFFCLTDFLVRRLKKGRFIIVGHDTRDTGAEMAWLYLQVANSCKLDTTYVGTMALPETLAHVASDKHCDGFVYFTASHNPPEYNGIKIGLGDGCVLKQKSMQLCIKKFCDRYLYEKHKKDVKWLVDLDLSKKAPPKPNQSLIKKMHQSYSELIQSITYFSHAVDGKKQKSSAYQKAIGQMQKELKRKKVTVVIDYNGSSRLHSAEPSILKNYGISLRAIGCEAGVFQHDIVPEGKSLNLLEKEMKKTMGNVFAGMVVDCDGDRGNLLLASNTKKIFRLSAQHTFALALLADLTTLKEFFPHRLKKNVVVVNDASSLLVDKICQLYEVSCKRCETGEANVLSLAAKQRKRGYEVRIAGEGSNGGNIIFPHTVRDPLTTLLAALRLFYLKKGDATLAEIALKKIGASFENDKQEIDCLVSKILIWFSQFRSTAVFEKKALLKFRTKWQVDMEKFNKTLLQNWMQKERAFFSEVFDKKFPNYRLSTKIVQHVGAKEIKINSRKDLSQVHEKGGATLCFLSGAKKNAEGTLKGFWWVRPSQTEPVLRLATEWCSKDNSRAEIKKAEKIKNWLQKRWRKWIKAHLKQLKNKRK